MVGFGQPGFLEKERLELVTMINWCSNRVVHIFSLVHHCCFSLREVAFCIVPGFQLTQVPGFSADFNVCCNHELDPLVTLGSSVLCLSHLATGQDFWESPAPSACGQGKDGK